MRALLVLAALALGGCVEFLPYTPQLDGQTMGSEWTVRLTGPTPAARAVLQAGAQARFDAVDRALSTYKPDSALSRFNENDSGEWQDIDPELAAVMAYGLGLAE